MPTHGFTIAALLTFCFAVLCCTVPAGAQRPADPVPGENLDAKPDRGVNHLYFANPGSGFLTAETRRFEPFDSPEAHASHIVRKLIAGSHRGWKRTLPEGTKLRALYILENGTAYVDLNEAVRTHHPGGVQMEQLTIYAVVNSLVLNVPEIRAVKILIGGRESLTLAGHLDLRFPLKAKMLLIR